jgi:phosphoribosylanthranilate isomerase
VTKIKICGVTQPDDAARVAAAGVDFIGLNFWPTSKRYLSPERAPQVAVAARASSSSAGSVQLVGVFVNAPQGEIAAIARDVALDVIQVHGDESPDDVAAIARATGLAVWKALAAAGPGDLAHLDAWPVDAILLDAPAAGRGGAGKTFDWTLARDARRDNPARKLVIAGGLGPHNVGAAIEAVDPWAVDVASGVESAPGIKDPAKVAAFVAAVRACGHRS